MKITKKLGLSGNTPSIVESISYFLSPPSSESFATVL